MADTGSSDTSPNNSRSDQDNSDSNHQPHDRGTAFFKDIIDKRLKRVEKKKDKRESSFKYKSNQQQYEFNEEVLDQLESISLSGRAKKKLKKAMKKLKRRNKLIKMADKSKAGWKLVEEYLTDDVASDEEDDKKIKKAEKQELAKIADDKEKRKKDYGASSSKGPRERFRNASRYDRRYCFRCGREGHEARECKRRSDRRDDSRSDRRDPRR